MIKEWASAAAAMGRPRRPAAVGGGRRRRATIAVACWLAAALAALLLSSAAQARLTGSPPGDGGRGSVVSYQRAAGLTVSQARDYVRAAGFGSPAPVHGVRIYRITYRTVGIRGEPVRASGVLALPVRHRRYLRVVAFEHGTMVAKADAPSVSATSRGEVVLLAGAGYAAVEPDYLGLGTGPGQHPFMDPGSETTASADLIRAAGAVASRLNYRLSSSVLVTGFSQGGQAAMALGRGLQDGAAPHLRLAAVAAISGPYDIQHAEIPAALDGRLDGRTSAFYIGYWVTAMNRLHNLYADPAEAFLTPYDTTVPALYDGRHSDQQIFSRLPARPQALFTTAFLRRIAYPRGEVLRLIRADDTTCAWAPRAPVRLYAATGDTQVAYLNSVSCQRQLAARGVRVPLIRLGHVDHFPSEHLALPRAVRWFERRYPA